MRDETKLIHAGYAGDPTTHAVATPIYQTVAYEFDSAQHGADLFNLAVPGNIYTRIMNPTTDVLEKRVAALEGGVGALAVSAGSAAINYAILNIATVGRNIVSTPQLYGGTYTLFAHMLPGAGHQGEVRRRATGPRTSPPRSTPTRARSSARASATRPATSRTLRVWRRWRTRTACR